MDTKSNPTLKLAFFLSLILKIHFSYGVDSISTDDVLSGQSTIISASRVFEMGFFRPGTASNYYVGIWHLEDTSRRAVWVANREKPVSLASELRITDGNLVLYDELKQQVWSTNVSSSSTTSRSVQAVLLDSGNLVLNDKSSGPSIPLWESFEFPSHAWLPGAKIGYNKTSKTREILTSWKNSEDPAPGLFSVQLDQVENSVVILWNRTKISWTSGRWDGHIFSGIPEMKRSGENSLFTFVSDENESYITYTKTNTSTLINHFEMDVTGQLTQLNWRPNDGWNAFWSVPSQRCELYSLCGAYANCKSNEKSLTPCQCLMGFEPNSPSDWELKDYSGGCYRKTKLQCEMNNSNDTTVDRFLEMADMSVPENEHSEEATSLAECESRCLSNCSCSGYSYGSLGCTIFSGELLNLKQLVVGDSRQRTLYIRLADSEFRMHSTKFRRWKLYVLLFGVIAIAMVISFIACFIYLRRRKRAANKQELDSLTDSGQFKEDEKEGMHVPFVALANILAATDNFSEANKLGQGGFGPVYKGKFPGDQDIAIKRLSSGSGQGSEEFKNEVLLIAKLQHRNLVRLLGYCAERNEQILIYEYMPNKSLDSFLFENFRELLNWEIRFHIIMGIARGLLYLHHDSRLRIIHRDLKISNVLLDEEMNPKISDFGLAKIFEGKQTEGSTNRVVGTYGYMSPEYAIEGLFSTKSDVFSFGIVTLEIITGQRNSKSYRLEQGVGLIGYVWEMWNESKAVELIDSTLRETLNEDEFMRCVRVALLCVQDDPNDRPTMSNVIMMLGSETASLPSPQQPTFVVKRFLSSTPSLLHSSSSSNLLTDSLYQGR
ncbi:G-type lectin S-receptor-like serine/threonine-protein kinase At4g03230 isoform X2 [Humulus lupulus]|uniref:G-type lectin S-receptor-like serine/threonine-protein kinase At4g03230 isoform X2 n=1 Tax=Humulus lupulus TaxID=3486 RepID=UPI002B404420|nr:G-type lectin S-receptor-like serine/threonine-protein kinase At4g03230 isoform X2 [Humulus lupulus]